MRKVSGTQEWEAFSGPPLCARGEGGRSPTHPGGSGGPSSPGWPEGQQERADGLRGQENPVPYLRSGREEGKG